MPLELLNFAGPHTASVKHQAAIAASPESNKKVIDPSGAGEFLFTRICLCWYHTLIQITLTLTRGYRRDSSNSLRRINHKSGYPSATYFPKTARLEAGKDDARFFGS